MARKGRIEFPGAVYICLIVAIAANQSSAAIRIEPRLFERWSNPPS